MSETPGNHRQDNRAQSSCAALKSVTPAIVAGTASASSPEMAESDRMTSKKYKCEVSTTENLRHVLASGLRAMSLPRQQAGHSSSSPPAHHVLAQSETAAVLACPSGFLLMPSRTQKDQEWQPEDVVSRIQDEMPICIGGQSSARDATLVVAMLVA